MGGAWWGGLGDCRLEYLGKLENLRHVLVIVHIAVRTNLDVGGWRGDEVTQSAASGTQRKKNLRSCVENDALEDMGVGGVIEHIRGGRAFRGWARNRRAQTNGFLNLGKLANRLLLRGVRLQDTVQVAFGGFKATELETS